MSIKEYLKSQTVSQLFPCPSKEGICVPGKLISPCKSLNAQSQELCSLNHLSCFLAVAHCYQHWSSLFLLREKSYALLYYLFTHYSHTTVYLSQEPRPSSLDLFSTEQYFLAFASSIELHFLHLSFSCCRDRVIRANTGAGMDRMRWREQRGRCAGFFSLANLGK